jgi:hypothetical protein
MLWCWQWFRERCIQIYKIDGLPETFGENDGKIIERKWVDPEEDWTAPPPEYNYDWRTQDLSWKSGGFTVSFTRNDDIHSRYIRFELIGEGIQVKLRLSEWSKGEAAIQDSEETTALWEREIRALTEPAG